MVIAKKDLSQPGRNLKHADLSRADLSYVTFLSSDLRGADLSFADLTGATFSNVKTGIAPRQKVFIIVAALIVSMLSGLVAVMSGQTVQVMLASDDPLVKTSGFLTLVIVVLFIGIAIWKGIGDSLKGVILPVFIVATLVGLIAYLTGLGTGSGMLYLIGCLVLVVIMVIVGAVARVVGGSLSNILFVVIAVSGALFARSVGGGIGAMVMSVGCAVISKRALSNAHKFTALGRVAAFVTANFGTSFRGSRLTSARFSGCAIRNADFSNADLSFISWENCKKINCKN